MPLFTVHSDSQHDTTRPMTKRVTVTCPCGEDFETWASRIKVGKGKFCSKDCGTKYRKPRPTGLNYEIKVENPTWYKKGEDVNPRNNFPKGHEPWNKGTTGAYGANSGSFQPGSKPWNKGAQGVMPSGEAHHMWVGDEVGYNALHTWVARNKSKPTTCEQCGENKPLDWANVSHEYKRDLDDWMALCRACHIAYDKKHRGAKKKKFGNNE